MYRLDSADHFLSIQCDLFCHLQRKRYPPHYPGRASAQNPPFLFREKDLADLTSTIMADCTFLEQSFSHFIPELAGSIISTVLISIGLLFTDWRMALAALWVLPVAFAIVGFSAKIQENLNQKAMDVKMACADGIQECIETVRDLKANNAEQAYLKGLEKKIRAVEHRSILNEFGLAVFVVSASLVLKLGIATVALVGAVLLMQGSLSVLTFFMFLLVVSRLYDLCRAHSRILRQSSVHEPTLPV